MRRVGSAVLLVSLVLGACGDDESVAGTGDTVAAREDSISDLPLIGTDWTVIGFVDGEASELVDAPGETPAAVGFEENGFVSGSDGCNGFGYVVDETATDAERAELGLVYEIDGNRITFAGSPLSTLRGCPGEDYESYGQAVMAVLRGTVTYQIDGHQLTLRAVDGRGVMYTADG
jgi:heat shock protein HslJ